MAALRARESMFDKLRLSHKIAAIGAVGIAGVVAIGGIYLWGASQQARYQDEFERADAIARIAGRISVGMLEARRAEKDFLLRDDEKYVKRHLELTNAIAADLDSLARRLDAAGQAAI